ncbi:MAG: UDP-N-acetylglucosamine 1-carboxyvinyltransferase [Candidatus Krumholzibacteriota bacterium]|nr:UDP-N-acetylglucosamine 1-carboxyvinyltransferase [Candidatus Krumholzibacteriota bacterium]
MDSFLIKGPCRLQGTVEISGAKNAMLPLMAASILTGGECVLENVPELRDTLTMKHLLEVLGVPVELGGGRMVMDASRVDHHEAPYDLVRTMRASIYVLGPLVAKFGRARVSLPGGCAWGPRPINLHLLGLKALGAEIKIDHGYIDAAADRLRGNEIILSLPSVGATINLIMAAVLAEGKTVIENAAREPEVSALAAALKKSGAIIEGEGTSRLEIEGVSSIRPFRHRVIPDRVEAGTYAAAAVLTGGEVEISGCRPDHMTAVINKLTSCGAEIDMRDNGLLVRGPEVISPVDIETGFYPSFPTDMQAQMMAVLCRARGSSSVMEHVYTERFTHVPELRRFGAQIILDGSVAVVTGVDSLQGAPVMATDIRASSALILAGLVSEGETKVLRIYHIDRGYERIEEKLRALGADIQRIKS